MESKYVKSAKMLCSQYMSFMFIIYVCNMSYMFFVKIVQPIHPREETKRCTMDQNQF